MFDAVVCISDGDGYRVAAVDLETAIGQVCRVDREHDCQVLDVLDVHIRRRVDLGRELVAARQLAVGPLRDLGSAEEIFFREVPLTPCHSVAGEGNA